MTDDEILKRLAEIEGYSYVYTHDLYGMMFTDRKEHEAVSGFAWNPLINGDDLLPLMEKYAISTECDMEQYKPEKIVKEWCAWLHVERPYKDSTAMTPFSAEHKSLPHAICLAIIEAHK